MKIICIGRNYVAHAKELKNEVPTTPVFFMKPDTALLKDNAPFYIPTFSNEIHYEVELVIKISKNGKTILPQFAHKYYDQITVGIDFTARDLQEQCKEKGLPWEKAKAFDHSAVIGRFISLSDLQKKNEVSFSLFLNKKDAPLEQLSSQKYDLVIVGHNAIHNFEMFKKNCHYKALVLDNSNSLSFIKEANRQSLSFHNIKTDKAFVMEL